MKDTIMEMPDYQRPYEKCLREGEQSLSDRELLAVILRCGVQGSSSLTLADKILNLSKQTGYSGLLGLFHISMQELMKIHGIGKVKAIQLKCIGELSKRMATAAAKPELSFHHPVTIAKYYMERLRHEEQELLYCMMLDGHNHLSGEQLLSRGTVNATLITPREVFVEAVKYRAAARWRPRSTVRSQAPLYFFRVAIPPPARLIWMLRNGSIIVVNSSASIFWIISSSVITGMSVSAKKGFLMNILK